jgi:hypothetical protein
VASLGGGGPSPPSCGICHRASLRHGWNIRLVPAANGPACVVGIFVRGPSPRAEYSAASLARGRIVCLLEREYAALHLPVMLTPFWGWASTEYSTVRPSPLSVSVRAGSSVLPAEVYFSKDEKESAELRPCLARGAEKPLRHCC